MAARAGRRHPQRIAEARRKARLQEHRLLKAIGTEAEINESERRLLEEARMTFVGIVCAVLLGLTGLLCLVRIVRGPTCSTAPSRPTCSSAACVGAIGVEAAIGRHNTTLPILVALALVAFLGSVSIARYAAQASGGGQ